MVKTLDRVAKQLDEGIPRAAVATRQGGGPKALSYLEGWYVINRLNEVFGAEGWSYDVTDLKCVHAGEIPGKYGSVQSASYTATVALFVQFPGADGAKRITDVGFGNGTDKTDPGKPHELATKEAVTDALKRSAKSLGMSMGLALYDKTQENVEDTAEQPAPSAVVQPKAEEKTPAPATNNDALVKLIIANAKVVVAKNRKSMDEIKADIKSKYGVDKVAELSHNQAMELLETLKGLTQ